MKGRTQVGIPIWHKFVNERWYYIFYNEEHGWLIGSDPESVMVHIVGTHESENRHCPNDEEVSWWYYENEWKHSTLLKVNCGIMLIFNECLFTCSFRSGHTKMSTIPVSRYCSKM